MRNPGQDTQVGMGLAFLQRTWSPQGGLHSCPTQRRYQMADLNRKKDGLENQADGLGKQAEGRARNTVGAATGDTSEQIKGKAQEVGGKVQRKVGEAQEDSADDRDRDI